jgi:hypothetical protein
MANTTIPVELSSTPGIVDNSNATAITIDSSERVGIGESSPSDTLELGGGNIVNPNSTGSEITSATFGIGQNIHLEERQVNGAFSDRTDLAIVTNSGFGLGESEKIRIEASGNLTLKNTNNIANITTAAITLTGAGGGGTGGQTVNIATTAYVGVLTIATTQGVSALYYINGTSATQVVVQNAVDARFSNTSGAGNTVNIYVSGSNIVLENNIQATRSFYITFMGKF